MNQLVADNGPYPSQHIETPDRKPRCLKRFDNWVNNLTLLKLQKSYFLQRKQACRNAHERS